MLHLISVLPTIWATGLLDQVSSIISVVLLIVMVAVTAYAALNREQLKTVRENNADLVQRVSILEGAETRLTGQVTALETAAEAREARHQVEMAAKQQENEVLRSVVTNEAHLTSIEDLVVEHHGEARQFWKATSEDMHAIRIALTEGNP